MSALDWSPVAPALAAAHQHASSISTEAREAAAHNLRFVQEMYADAGHPIDEPAVHAVALYLALLIARLHQHEAMRTLDRGTMRHVYSMLHADLALLAELAPMEVVR